MYATAGGNVHTRFGDFEFDLRAGELRHNGDKIKLGERPLQVLAALLEHPGEVVTREELQQKIWPADTFVDFEHSINTAVLKLRNALGDNAENPHYIETLPRHGYRFICKVEMAEDAARTAAGEAGVVLPAKAALRRYRTLALAVGAVVAIAAGLVALNVAGLRERFLNAVRASYGPPKIRSIAVLPLVNLSRDPDQEYFADGITEELITTLGKISALRVISRTSVMGYKGTKKSLPAIARELKVDALVEGTVLRSGDRIRITANLLHAPSDRHLWAESYERVLGDILALQSDVARTIASQIRIKLTTQELARLASARPVNPEAHLAYLRGRHALEKYTEKDLTKALAYFQQAIEIDPSYAPAYAGMADAHYGFSNLYLSPRKAIPMLRAAALRALALDESLAEAHVSLAISKSSFEYDYPGAEAELKRAIELNPNLASAHLWYGWLLAQRERFDEARIEVARAHVLDPLSLNIRVYGFLTLYFARQYDEALKEMQEILLTDPNYYFVHAYLGMAYEQQGKLSEAVAELERAAALDDSAEPRAQLAHAYALAGRNAEARKLLADLLERAKRQYLSPYNIALIYVALGDHPRALRSLEEALEDKSEWCIWLNVDPRLDALRSTSRFQGFLRRINTPQVASP